ncbi:MAG: T9SS type A sorting domain-containing protein [Rhodothermales bacterium]
MSAVDACRSGKIYRMSRDIIERFRRNGEVSPELRDWPWDLGAPVVDGDGDNSNYDIENGDLPALHGDSMLWWVMNDVSSRNQYSLDLEVRVIAYVLAGRGMQETTLFLKYSVINKSDHDLGNGRFALFVSPNIEDDAGGTDTTRAMVYAYGANDYSSTDPELISPAIGVILLADGTSTPEVYSSIIELDTQSVPRIESEYILALDSRRPGGSQFLEGGFGRGTTQQCPVTQNPVRIMYPGDPVTGSYWSMENLTGNPDQCSLNTINGRTESDVVAMLTSTARVDIPAGGEAEYAYAISWARGSSRHDSILKLRDNADVIRMNSSSLLNSVIETTPPEDVVPSGLFFTAYPNPTEDRLRVTYSIPSPAIVEMSIHNALGHTVLHRESREQLAGEYSDVIDVSSWPAGVYVIRHRINSRSFSKTVVVL